MGMNTVHSNAFSLSATSDVFFLFFSFGVGEAGISQAGLALVVRSARPWWVFGTAFHGPPLLGIAAGLAGGCGTANL